MPSAFTNKWDYSDFEFATSQWTRQSDLNKIIMFTLEIYLLRRAKSTILYSDFWAQIIPTYLRKV